MVTLEVGVTGGMAGIGADVVPTVEGRLVMVAGGDSNGLGGRGLILILTGVTISEAISPRPCLSLW